MPYIKEDERECLKDGTPIHKVGVLTYLIQQNLKRYWVNSPQNYQAIAEILGALEGARFDFEERIVRDYEARKLRENGDVW